MTYIKSFIMTLIIAAVAHALIDGFLPKGEISKAVRYLTSLIMILILVSPFAELVKSIPHAAASAELFTYRTADAITRANSIVALRIERSLCEKFGIDDGNIEVKYDGEGINVRLAKRPGFITSDFELYIMNNFGVSAEVEFYE